MIPLTLPSENRHTILRSFWFVISFFFGAGLCFAGWMIEIPFPVALGFVGSAVCGMLVITNEKLTRRIYDAWNRRLVRSLAGFLSRVVMRVCFFIVFLATGKVQSKFNLGGHAQTAWEGRESLSKEAYNLPFTSSGPSSLASGWIRNYLKWAVRSGNSWCISLIPFLCLLRVFVFQEEKDIEANIYTLF